MFRLKEIKEVVKGQLFCGDPRLRVSGVSIDSRTIKRGELFVAIKGSRFDGHNFIREAVKKGAAAVIGSAHSPQTVVPTGIPYIRVADTRRALGDLARFHRQRFNVPVIAVGGSNGKTTTKDMIAWILSSRIRVLKSEGTQNNDIGVPLTLLKLDASYDAVVLELGTNHFGEIAYLSGIARPNLAVITNIGPAHLENLKSLAGVYKEKTALLKNLKPPGIAVLNADDSRLRKLKNSRKVVVVSYGIRNQSDFCAARVREVADGFIEFFVNPVSSRTNAERRIRLRTVGCFNVYNALAAVATCRLLGWSYQCISSCLENFVFPSGRLNLLISNGIAFLDDSYNANPASFEEALKALSGLNVKGRRILVMGDMLELGTSAEIFHRRLGSQIASVCDAFIGVGELSRFSAAEARRAGMDRNHIFTCLDSAQARDLLFGTLKPSPQDLILVKGSRRMRMEEVLKVVSCKD